MMDVAAAAVEVAGSEVVAYIVVVVGMQTRKGRAGSAHNHNFDGMGCEDLLMEDRREV